MGLRSAYLREVAVPLSSISEGAETALQKLLDSCRQQLPDEILEYVDNVLFTSTTPGGNQIFFPTPLKEQEAGSAIKALEACAAAAMADLRYGTASRAIEVDVDKTACFLVSAYLATIDGRDKSDPAVKASLPKTDLNKAQSILYRRLSANLYETKTPGEYYHIHGSMEASKTLSMIGMAPFRPDLVDYRECINAIEHEVKKFTVRELESLTLQNLQAGAPVLKASQFRKTPHGQAMASLPPLTIRELEQSTPPAPFAYPERAGYHSASQVPQCLQGIRVLEMCRVIAGPTIGRSLAAHGADVLKVTSDKLPDIPFFQVEVNTGKHTTSLHLRPGEDGNRNTPARVAFEALLEEADVLIDGYRPGSLARLGYGPSYLAALAQHRGKGFVYVAEDCFGGTGSGLGTDSGGGTPADPEWSGRRGWQQIADCVTGVAWEQGRFMGLEEPVVPPFPMSDYGTGALGAVAAMAGLHRRATRGGSWACRTSLVQYDLFLLSLGPHARGVQDRLRKDHDRAFFDLRHSDSVDEVGARAMRSLRRLHPAVFGDDDGDGDGGGDGDSMLQRAWSEGFGAELRWPREAIRVEGLRVGHVRAGRPNGFDAPSWEGWEVDAEVVNG